MQQRKHPLAQCESCPLYHRPFVPSHMPEEAVIAVVGEAPGYEEAKQGVPFVGVSGQLLDRCLSQLGVSPKQVAKTNAVLCHPEYNETPTPQALHACAPRLAAEVHDLPAIPLVTLGLQATQALDKLSGMANTGGITSRQGEVYRLSDTKTYLATVHPAYVLRKPDSVRGFMTDLQKALTPAPVTVDWSNINYTEVTPANIKRIKKYLESVPQGTELSFDTETTNLQWFKTKNKRASDLLCLVFAFDLDHAFIVPPMMIQPLYHTLTALFDRCETIAHNGKYDQIILRRLKMRVRLDYDTMLASFNLNELKGYHGLKYLVSTYLDAPDYERDILGADFVDLPSKDKDYSKLPKDKLYRYAAIDAVATLALKRTLQPLVVEDQVSGGLYVTLRGNIPTLAAEWSGIRIDRPYVEALQDLLSEQLAHLTEEMWRVIEEASQGAAVVIHTPHYVNPTNIVHPYAEVTKGAKRFNPGSTAQMSYFIYDFFGLKLTKAVGYKVTEGSTQDEALAALEPHPFIDYLREYRRASKALTTYVNKILDIADLNDRVHIRFNLNGAETGRLSADDSMHGIYRPTDFLGKAIRGAFIAGPERRLVIADYSQAELRVIAAESGEPFFLNAFNAPDEERHKQASLTYPDFYLTGSQSVKDKLAKLVSDVHSQTALFLFGDAYEQAELRTILYGDKDAEALAKELRTFAKNFNFGNIYQGGATGIWSMTEGKLPLERVQELLKIYRSKTPVLQSYTKRQFLTAKRNGCVTTRMGRKRRFPLLTHDNIDEIRKASVNMPIQSMASDLTLLAGATLIDHGVMIVHMIHDSLIADVSADRAQEVAQLMSEVMIATGEQYFPEVAWAVDVDIADRWYENRPDLSALIAV